MILSATQAGIDWAEREREALECPPSGEWLGTAADALSLLPSAIENDEWAAAWLVDCVASAKAHWSKLVRDAEGEVCGTCKAVLKNLTDCLDHLQSDYCEDCTQMPAWPPDATVARSLTRQYAVWSWDCRREGSGYALAGSCGDDAHWVPCVVNNGVVEHDPSREDVWGLCPI